MFEEKLKIAKEIAEQFKGIDGVIDSYVDDYSRINSDFQVIARLDFRRSNKPNSQSFNLRKIRLEIKKIINSNKNVSFFGKNVSTLERQYYSAYGEKTFTGYDRNYIMIDFIIMT